MKTVGFQTADELADYLSAVGKGVLFRGQMKEYLDRDNRPHLSTSFGRNGCIPPRMLKWQHYGSAILRSFVKGFDDQPDIATDQAILQHYGWRSFFIDATSNPAVACWFASNVYQSERCINLAEDCFEEPANLIHERAAYSPCSETGVVYVISKKALRAKTIQAVDLAEIVTSTGHPRYLAQSAWMIGPLAEALPSDCIATKIIAPSSVLLDYARRSAIQGQRDLFPAPGDDPVLAALLSVPWVHRPLEGDDDPRQLLFYERGLPLPEYGWAAVKRHPARIAFYRPFWLANEFGPDEPFASATYLLTPEPLFYGTADIERPRLPALIKLLRAKGSLVIEMDGLLLHPHANQKTTYGKGLLVTLESRDLLSLSEILVDHPGMRPTSYGTAAGRSYKIHNGGELTLAPQPNDCPCGNDEVHNHHLVIASHVDAFLSERRYKRVGRGNVYACSGVDPTANLRHLKSEANASVPYFAIDMANDALPVRPQDAGIDD